MYIVPITHIPVRDVYINMLTIYFWHAFEIRVASMMYL